MHGNTATYYVHAVSDPSLLQNSTDGSNVVSVTFQPHDNILVSMSHDSILLSHDLSQYAAWERSSGATWRPGT